MGRRSPGGKPSGTGALALQLDHLAGDHLPLDGRDMVDEQHPGVLFIDHISAIKRQMITRKMVKLKRERARA